jgi:hypothetical protein
MDRETALAEWHTLAAVYGERPPEAWPVSVRNVWYAAGRPPLSDEPAELVPPPVTRGEVYTCIDAKLTEFAEYYSSELFKIVGEFVEEICDQVRDEFGKETAKLVGRMVDREGRIKVLEREISALREENRQLRVTLKSEIDTTIQLLSDELDSVRSLARGVRVGRVTPLRGGSDAA